MWREADATLCLVLTIVDHGFESWLGSHRQYDYECNSTGTDIARFYFRMAILVYPDMQFAMALIIIIASKQAGRAGFIFLGGHAEASCPCIKPVCPENCPFSVSTMLSAALFT